jgi:hypothetical protein
MGTSATITRVDEGWKLLTAAGLPDGAPRPKPVAVDFDAIRRAISTLDVATLDDVHAVVLRAWLEGFWHHWPSRFERELGRAGATLRAVLNERHLDANRYIKLRRIAVENLSAAL